MWNEDTACNIMKNEEVIKCESGGAQLPLVAASTLKLLGQCQLVLQL